MRQAAKVGDRVEIRFPPSWAGVGVVTEIHRGTALVRMETGMMAGIVGGFTADRLPVIPPVVETIEFLRQLADTADELATALEAFHG